jgi:nucleotide-binding universal stress UspA family protein
MTYKSILVHADQSPHAVTRYQLAARLALDFDAHLIGAALTGVSRFLPPEVLANAGAAVADQLALMVRDANAALDNFSALAGKLGVASHERRLVNDDVDGGLALQARYVDLTIVSQFDPNSSAMAPWSDLPEYLFMNTARPVLVLPHRSIATDFGQHALLAWDCSLEATRALTASLPLLKKAQNVTVLVLNAAHNGEHGAEPGADIALYLSRHGVKVNVVQRETQHEVGAAILAHAARIRADLMIMGGYGHSRFRELLIGGATRSVLTGMTVPVLFAH